MIEIKENYSLLAHNTFGIDVKTDYFAEYSSKNELIELLNATLLTKNKNLQIGSGSNLLFLSDFKGVVLHSKINSINLISEDENTVLIEAGSGVVWDDFVCYCIKNNWYGTENLSFIPGEVGAAAVQNIGAYGKEAKDIIEEVHTVDYETKQTHIFFSRDCNYAYRDSIFKNQLKNKHIVYAVRFRLSKIPVYELSYQHLEEQVRKKGEISLENIRKTVIETRKEKLPDPKIEGNAGSFFTNPIIDKKQFLDLKKKYPQMPHYPVSDELEKLSAAWLIDQSAWKGKQIGKVAVHNKQALVIVNKGNANGSEIAAFAEKIQTSVAEKFGVYLHPEVNYI